MVQHAARACALQARQAVRSFVGAQRTFHTIQHTRGGRCVRLEVHSWDLARAFSGELLAGFNSLPIGSNLMSAEAMKQVIAWSSMMFLGALLTALPVMVALLFINIGLGVATRAAPSLNIFSVGFPAMIFAGFGVLFLALPGIGARIQWLWMQGFFQVRTLVGIT